jgi:double-strand break repair protein MRE11
MLPEWLDLVIWGHEHESRDVEESLQGTFRILQPGSTVATSLVAGEARKKHVALLQVRGQQFKLDRIPLTQVRPFRMESIALRDFDDLDPADPKVEFSH